MLSGQCGRRGATQCLAQVSRSPPDVRGPGARHRLGSSPRVDGRMLWLADAGLGRGPLAALAVVAWPYPPQEGIEGGGLQLTRCPTARMRRCPVAPGRDRAEGPPDDEADGRGGEGEESRAGVSHAVEQRQQARGPRRADPLRPCGDASHQVAGQGLSSTSTVFAHGLARAGWASGPGSPPPGRPPPLPAPDGGRPPPGAPR